jgi:hypothetical protein
MRILSNGASSRTTSGERYLINNSVSFEIFEMTVSLTGSHQGHQHLARQILSIRLWKACLQGWLIKPRPSYDSFHVRHTCDLQPYASHADEIPTSAAIYSTENCIRGSQLNEVFDFEVHMSRILRSGTRQTGIAYAALSEQVVLDSLGLPRLSVSLVHLSTTRRLRIVRS